MNNLKEQLINKIKTGEVNMTPHWRFVLRTMLLATTTIIVTLIAIYLLSFVFFTLRETGVIFAPLFGWSGLVLFVVHSPWLLTGATALFLLLLYILVTHYSFSYKKPLVYSIVGIVLLVTTLSSLIQQTNLHRQTGDYAKAHNLPGLAPLYRNLENTHPDNVTHGTIVTIAERNLTISTKEAEEYIVIISPTTKLPKRQSLNIGDLVIVFGPTVNGRIEAFGIRPDNNTPFMRQTNNHPPLKQ